jgi:hypothetical protein
MALSLALDMNLLEFTECRLSGPCSIVFNQWSLGPFSSLIMNFEVISFTLLQNFQVSQLSIWIMLHKKVRYG